MASRSLRPVHPSESAQLHALLSRWEHHHKRRVLSRTLPRTLMAALVISLIFGIIAYIRFRWPVGDFARAAAVICGGGVLVSLLHALLFTRPRLTQARCFDLEFGLQERVSTALELLEGRIQTRPEIEAAQIADALAQAGQIDAREKIRPDFRRREWLALLILLAALLLLIAVPLLVGEELIPAGPSAAVQAAQDDVRDIIESIATDTSLEDIDRQALLNALEIALERLQEQDISDDEAFAAMSQLTSQIEDIENPLQDAIDLDQSALEAALEAMENFRPLTGRQEDVSRSESDLTPPGLDELSQALSELGQAAQSMSQDEAQEAAEAMQQAAQELTQMNPELSEQLQEIAATLQRNDRQSLQEQLNEAQEQLAQEQQASQQMRNAQQMLQSQAEQAQEAADEIARQPRRQSQRESTAPQQGAAETTDSDRQRPGQPSGASAEAAQAGENQGNQPAQRNRPNDGENREGEQDSSTAGQGAGEGEASNISLPGSGGEDQGVETDNQTTGAGEIDYAAIYSPTGIEGGGDSEIQLRTDATDQILAEGSFDDNPLGESRVSYDTVFSDYQQAANRALESDYVPLGLRDVVRDYFTSLEPNSG